MGLKMAGIPQSIEAYCDDVNVLTDKLSDFVVVDLVVRRFEAVSGAILSRAKKSKVIGFGTWLNKTRVLDNCQGDESVWNFRHGLLQEHD